MTATQLALVEALRRPYDDKGHFVPTECPDPNCTPGRLVYEGNGYWRCDGLVDPNDPSKELEACDRSHRDGAALARAEQEAKHE